MEKYILCIESSCDETAAALVAGGPFYAQKPFVDRLVGAAIASQIDIHRRYGGVVPEVAARAHVEALPTVLQQTLGEHGWADISAVAVTQGPGLIGPLLTGLCAAKGIAAGLGVPLIGCHHIAAHIAACWLEHAPQLPALCLVVSGGHTQLVWVEEGPPNPVGGNWHMRILGKTRDDAAGEAFDKTARLLGLPYPGGPEISKAAITGNPHALTLPRAKMPDAPYDFSFSGLKTALMQAQHRHPVPVADAAASVEYAITNALVTTTQAALQDTNAKTLLLAGGVASNQRLRRDMAQMCGKTGVELIVPTPKFCTDNAAMLAPLAWALLEAGLTLPQNADATAHWPL